MAKIKEILSIHLDDDIKSVVDLNAVAEETLKEELEEFILTESAAKHLSDFCDLYSRNVKQTGVWLNGFYGSGKSYLAKVIGMLLSNKSVLGTPAQERFMPKLDGLKQKDLLQNSINALGRTRNHVVQFDAAKESSGINLSQMMLGSFMRSLGFLDNLYGMIEFDLWLYGRYDEFKATVKQLTGHDWIEARKNMFELPKVMKQAYIEMGSTQSEYDDALALYKEHRAAYDANKLVADLQRYLEKHPGTQIVYLIDEVSESVEQKRINILDLEGVSEALSGMGQKVWTIAIAQQKLDDVINATNIDRGKLVKVIDRFKNHIDIKAEEIDTIIRQRLLAKTDEGSLMLQAYFDNNSGMIGDITNLGGTNLKVTKTAKGYADYYPFFEHQFKMLQYFLFGSKALVQTQVGTRGMLISTFETLKREAVEDRDVFQHVNTAQLRRRAEDKMSETFYNRCQMADGWVKAPEYQWITGSDLLQTIDFLTRTEVVRTTAENIAKAYVSNPDNYYEVKSEVSKALERLTEERVLLFTDNQYRITSEAEERIISDMHKSAIATHRIKGKLIEAMKVQDVIRKTYFVTADGKKVDFASKMSTGEPLSQNQSAALKVTVHDLMTVSGNANIVEEIKVNTADSKAVISLVPDATRAVEIFNLQEEILRLEDLALNPAYSTPEEKEIVAKLTNGKADKEKALAQMIAAAYNHGQLVYCYHVTHLDEGHSAQQIADAQLRAFDNVYTRRLTSELSDALAPQVLKKSANQLKGLFASDEFAFFDTSGQFVGNQLTVVTEIMNLIKSYTSGAELEKILEDAPTGYAYGTIVTTLAALFRANKIIVKHNGEEYHSCKDQAVEKVFTNASAMRKADFKAVAKNLSYNERKDIVDILKDCNFKKWTGQELSYNLNDFEVVEAVRAMSLGIMQRINQSIMGELEKERIFNRSVQARDVLKQYSMPVTEANYYTTAQNFLQDEEFEKAVEYAERDLSFIKSGWDNLKQQREYIDRVEDELVKALGNAEKIEAKKKQFVQLFETNPVKEVKQLNQLTQDVRDSYYTCMQAKAKTLTAEADALKAKAEALKQKVLAYPKDWNTGLLAKIDGLIHDCERKHIEKVELDANSIKCKKSGFMLRDFTYCIDKLPGLENQLTVWETEIATKEPVGGGPDPDPVVVRKMKSQIPTSKLSVAEYKKWLTKQLSQLNMFGAADILDFDN